MYYVYYLGDTSILLNKIIEGYYFEYQPFWIGMGQGNRYIASLNEALNGWSKNKHKNNKAKKLLSEKKEPKSILLKENLSIEEAYNIEEMLIAKFGRKGIDKNGILVNLRKQGRHSNLMSAETKEKIRRKKFGKTAWNKGLTKETDDRVKKYSEKLTDHKVTEEQRKKMSIKASIRSMSEKYKKDFIKRMTSKECIEKRIKTKIERGSSSNEKNPKWRDIDLDKIKKFYHDGYTVDDIAKFFDVTRKVIDKRLKLLNLTKRKRNEIRAAGTLRSE